MKGTFGDRLRKARKDIRRTQDEIAKEFGMTKSQISRYETNSADPGVDVIAKLAKRYDVSTDWLLGITDEKKPSPVQKKSALSEEEKMRLAEGFKQYLMDFDFDSYMKENFKPNPQKEYKLEDYLSPYADTLEYDAIVDLRTFMREHGMQNENFAAFDLNEIASRGPKDIAQMKINLLKARDRQRKKL